ncbi:TonB-dependent receptor plug domain-containing protein [Tranquillimonas rosea]|uniref:TonB-dependent receptor plug domain-containing protein n=1 Tax=Tranquillimonas rosea TaxID=641238 RepID=UPI003BAA3F88
MTKRSSLLAGAATAALAATAAPAQEAFDLGEIIVSGGLTPVPEETYGRSASVVTADEIERRGITTVAEALRSVPGVSVSSSGGNSSQVRLRGGEANHTLILIDGVEAAAGDTGYLLSGFETGEVERIEVLRGPQSVYYGANASSGVINIITRKAEPGTHYGGSVEFGNGHSVTGFVSTRGARGGVRLSYTDSRDDGFDYSGADGEDDSVERETLRLSGDFAVTDDVTLGLTFRRAQETSDYDTADSFAATADGYIVDDPVPFGTRDERAGEIWARYEMLGGRLTHRLAYQLTDNESDYSYGTPIETRNESFKYRLSYGLDGRPVDDADQVVNVLLERQSDSSDSNPDYDRQTTSVALEYRGTFDNGLSLQAGLRHDENETFEDATTWTLGTAYELPGGVRLHASAGTGVVNPSYFELYADAFGYSGNPALSPETNRGYDIGVEVPLAGRGTIDVTYFDETLTDEIVEVATGPGAFSFSNQDGDSERRGLEVEGEMAVTDTLDLRMSYTYLDATEPDGSVEIRRPFHEIGLGATLATFGGRGTVSADLRHVAGAYDDRFFGDYSTVRLPDYTTVDVAARYQLTDEVALTGRAVNLFDADTVDVLGYAGRPRSFYAGFDARW